MSFRDEKLTRTEDFLSPSAPEVGESKSSWRQWQNVGDGAGTPGDGVADSPTVLACRRESPSSNFVEHSAWAKYNKRRAHVASL
jgi:hypothetical protein